MIRDNSASIHPISAFSGFLVTETQAHDLLLPISDIYADLDPETPETGTTDLSPTVASNSSEAYRMKFPRQ